MKITKIPRIVPSMPNWTLAAVISALIAVGIVMARHLEDASQAVLFAG